MKCCLSLGATTLHVHVHVYFFGHLFDTRVGVDDHHRLLQVEISSVSVDAHARTAKLLLRMLLTSTLARVVVVMVTIALDVVRTTFFIFIKQTPNNLLFYYQEIA